MLSTKFSNITVKLNEVEKQLNQKDMQTKAGYAYIKEFIDEMKIIIPAYDHLMQKFQLTNTTN